MAFAFPKLKKLFPQLQMGHGSDYTKYDNLILVNKLSWEQRRALANFLAQFAAILLGSGLVIPMFSENLPNNVIRTVSVSIISAGIIIWIMLWFLRGGKR